MSIIDWIGVILIFVLGVGLILAAIITRRIFPDSTRREP